MSAVSSKRLGILMLSPQYRPIVGGYERAAERLSIALANLGLRVVVITERRNSSWPAMEISDGYEVRRLPCLYLPRLHTISSLFSFAAYLLRYGRRFDIWHVHQYGYVAALAVALGRLLGRPVVLKLTSSDAMGIEKSMGSGLGKFFLRRLHRRVSACLAVSEETREEAFCFGIPCERIHIIPNGLDGSLFHPVTLDQRIAARRELGLVCERLVIFVGRVSPEKNPLGLLDAWAVIDTEVRAGALLALVGDGPQFGEVKTKVQSSGMAQTVVLAGARTDVAKWYQAADIFVISSHNEGLSNTMIEAMASGLPIISSRVSGSSILLEVPTAGVVVDINNVAQLADAIKSLLQDRKRRTQLGECARRRFEGSFSLAVTARKTIDVYKGLLHQAPITEPN